MGIEEAFVTFFQRDPKLALVFSQKVQALLAALGRSSFFQRHVLLRSTLLFVYDDASREELVELKIMNFGSSYEVPDGTPSLTHVEAWNGSRDSHEDGYLLGIKNLDRILRQVCESCAAIESSA